MSKPGYSQYATELPIELCYHRFSIETNNSVRFINTSVWNHFPRDNKHTSCVYVNFDTILTSNWNLFNCLPFRMYYLCEDNRMVFSNISILCNQNSSVRCILMKRIPRVIKKYVWLNPIMQQTRPYSHLNRALVTCNSKCYNYISPDEYILLILLYT